MGIHTPSLGKAKTGDCNMNRVLLTYTAVVIACAGCSKQNETQKESIRKEATVDARKDVKELKTDYAKYTALKSEDMLIRIGTNTITRADLDRIVNLRAKVVKMTLPAQQQFNAINTSAIRMPLLARLPETYRMQTALLKWAAENDIKPTPEELATFQKGFLASCKKPNADFAKFVKRNFTAEEIQTINERVHIEATCSKARKTYIAKNPAAIEKVDVDAYIKRVENYNRMASATNALIWAKATNVWNQAKAGADFAELAAEYSEDEGSSDDGGTWGVFRLSDLSGDGNLAKIVSALDVGAVSAPVEADNGLNLVKLVDVVNEQGEPVSGARIGDLRYELARIFFRLPEIYEIPARDEAARLIHEAATDRAVRKFVQGLIANDGAEFPVGTEIFENAQKALKMPSMLMQEGVTPQTMEDLKKKGKEKKRL